MIQDNRWPREQTKSVELSGSLANVVDKIARLKIDKKLSSITFHPPLHQTLAESKKIIDLLGDLLKSNHAIKSLKIDFMWTRLGETRAYVLETLAGGDAGKNLDSLWINTVLSGSIETGLLERYLRRNRDLKRLNIELDAGPTALSPIAALADSRVEQLCLALCLDTTFREIEAIGAALGQCGSISSLRLNLYCSIYRAEPLAGVESFFREGIAKMQGLTRLEIVLGRCALTPLVIKAIADLLTQRGDSLEHFGLEFYNTPKGTIAENWRRLGLALTSVKSMSLDMCSEEALQMVLPQLQSCEILELQDTSIASTDRFRTIGSIVSRLPNLRTITVTSPNRVSQDLFKDDFITMITLSNSIANAKLKPAARWDADLSIQEEISSYCRINKVFGTTLIGFGATNLWTKLLHKIQHSPARATLLYRLLREKPELIVGRARNSGGTIDCLPK